MYNVILKHKNVFEDIFLNVEQINFFNVKKFLTNKNVNEKRRWTGLD
jgi:hypothetical protein